MGRLAAFFDEQGIPLAGQQKIKMISLDREFEEMEAKLKVLESENLNLQAQVNPLNRQIDRMQDQIERAEAATAARNEKLDEKAEALLIAIARGIHIPRDGGAGIINGTPAEAQYYLGVLGRRHFVKLAMANYTVNRRYVESNQAMSRGVRSHRGTVVEEKPTEDDVLRRLLNTPPKPFTPKKKPQQPKKPAKK